MVLESIRLSLERIFYEEYSALIDYFVCNRRFALIIKKWVSTAEKSAPLGGSFVQRKKAVSKKTDTKWNSSTFSGTVSHFVEQFHNLWNRVPKIVELFHIVSVFLDTAQNAIYSHHDQI